MKDEIKRKLPYYIISSLITVVFVLSAVFLFPYSFGRLIEAFRDIGLSIGYFFCEIFGIEHTITPTVVNLPERLPPLPAGSIFLPETWSEFKSNWNYYWRLWTDKDNFLSYLSYLSNLLYVFSKVLIIIIPLAFGVYILFKQLINKQNNAYDKDTMPLKVWKRISKYTYSPVKNFIINFLAFMREHKKLGVLWLCIWLYNFNIFTVVLEFFAFYFYFSLSFDFIAIYRQIYKLCLDLSVMVHFIPLWGWIIIALFLFDKIRKSIAYSLLNHFEMRNRGFINARPIVYMVCGTMGKKKTTTITDMALSQDVMFRDKAFEKLLENDLKFPYFPWINLENELKLAIAHHEVYNLATTRLFVHKKRRRFLKKPCKEKLFDYDFEKYGYTYDDKLKVVDIWEVLENYAQLYFIYVIESSLLISNYSVRVENILCDIGNFPLRNTDFFRSDSRMIDSFSRHAHILDFDTLRLGRKVVENNRNSNNFEFGVVLITEIGKERGNNLGLQEVKKSADNANQKNDLFNSWLKMVRHSATVDNFPFVRVITDEQRPESWGADARDLCEIVHIRESSDTRLTVPFFAVEELLYSFIFGKFSQLYFNYRFNRGDNTLTMYLLKSIVSKVQHYYTRIYNRFGYCCLRVQVESGTQDGQLDDGKYYIMSKKIYSKRFSTDCFSDFFTEKALHSPLGIDDLREYASEKATFEELQEQNSYFMNDLLSGMNNRTNNNER